MEQDVKSRVNPDRTHRTERVLLNLPTLSAFSYEFLSAAILLRYIDKIQDGCIVPGRKYIFIICFHNDYFKDIENSILVTDTL